jgi:LytS/YehU family sensor histidine kinase
VFRYTLRRSEQEWAPLDQELAFARAYLDVEQARFGSRLSFAIDADPSLAGAQVPSMLLQTLVENAVKHGISRVRGAGRIDIRASRNGERLRLEVRDTGPGPHAATGTVPVTTGDVESPRDKRRPGWSPLRPDTGTVPTAPPQTPDGEGFGLRSVRERLAGYFGGEARLDLMREGETTVARIELPLVHQTSPMLGAAS